MTIFQKLYKGNNKEILNDLLEFYDKNKYFKLNYLYFANLIGNGILGNKPLNKSFLDALENSDFLLPDGIALRLYVKKYFGIELQNLNGTDFSDYIFSNLESDKYNLVLYGSKKEVVKKAVENIEKKYGMKVFYYQDGYREFDFSQIENIGNDKINLLMVGLGTPLQELWVENNLENIKKYNLGVLTQGGTFDFWAGNEKRAPKIFINLKLEWLWRFITNPKKNFKKVINSFYLFYYLLKKK